VNIARIFLPDALENPLGAGALGAHRNIGIFRLERLGDLLGHRQVDRRIVDDLAFLLGGFDQRLRDRLGRRRGGEHARGERRATQRGGTLQQLASG